MAIIKKSWSSDFKYLLIILILSVIPLFQIFMTPDNPHTSDGLPHIARIAAYYKEITAGQFPVRWASGFEYGYGTPIFDFFHPLPYLISVPFVAAGINLVTTLKIGFAISYILAGIFMYLFAEALFKDKQKALLVAVLYQFAPFRLVDMLIRGSLGSLYSYTALPLVLYGLTKLSETHKYRYFLLTAVASALLATSHNIIGFIFFGLAFIYTLFLLVNKKNWLVLMSALFWGLGIAAFFIVPAILDHKYTFGYLFTKDLFFAHFPPLVNFFIPNLGNWEIFRTAEVPVQIGLFHELAIILAIAAYFSRKISGNLKKLLGFCLVVLFLTMLLMQPVTKIIWEKISVIRQFQYPWRLLSVVAFLTALTGVQYLNLKIFKNKVYFYILIILIVVSTFAYWKPYDYQKIDEQYYWNYPESTNYYGEVQTIWVANPPAAYPKQYLEVIEGKALIKSQDRLPEKHIFTVDSKGTSTILDRTTFFPGWKVLVNNQTVPVEFQNELYRGLITFRIPNGISTVTVVFEQSKIQRLSNYLSLISLILLSLAVIPAKKRNIL